MRIDILKTPGKELLKKAVNVYDKQHRAIAKNIANVNNPNFLRVKTDFSEELQIVQNKSTLKATHPNHISEANYKSTPLPGEDNEGMVSITEEMANLAENQIRNEFVTKNLAGFFRKMQLSIKGRL